MFKRFDWFEFDAELYRGDLPEREFKAKQLAYAWSVWTGTSQKFSRLFKRGDQKAVANFAREAKGALLAPWVITALHRWQADGTLEAKARIRRVVNAWLDSRGRQPTRGLFQMIRRDKQIAIEILTMRQHHKHRVDEAIATVAQRHRLSEETIREIHRLYAAFAKRQFDSVKKALRYLKATDPEAIWNRVMSIWDDEGTVFFLEQEILRMKLLGEVYMEDLRLTSLSPGRFIDRVIHGTPTWLAVRVKRSNGMPVSGAAGAAGHSTGWIRVDVYERDDQRPIRTKFWEWENGRLSDVPEGSALHKGLILQSE